MRAQCPVCGLWDPVEGAIDPAIYVCGPCDTLNFSGRTELTVGTVLHVRHGQPVAWPTSRRGLGRRGVREEEDP
jgi:hypothetical protein